MSSPPSTRGAAPARPRRSRSVVAVVVALGAILAIAVAAVVVELITDAKWTPPDFPSLAAEPDPSLQGTVAYFAGQSRCVRVVAASGQPEKEVLCVGDQVDSRTGTPFKEMGPQLVWLPDGRLEVTMFRLAPADSPSTATTQLPLVAGWRKIIDVRTGQVEDVPAADLPAEPAQLPAPTVNAAGERIDTVAAAGRTEVDRGRRRENSGHHHRRPRGDPRAPGRRPGRQPRLFARVRRHRAEPADPGRLTGAATDRCPRMTG